tara:strand:+ start:47 stop:166 length:120 start_codon:yes stop_codon:yes gene_type:complete
LVLEAVAVAAHLPLEMGQAAGAVVLCLGPVFLLMPCHQL